MTLINLFIGFLKVGIFSFGGAYAAIPLIRDVVLSYGWLDDEMLTYIIAVSESTPGPIMINIATYVGASQAGIVGAMISTFAVALPAFIIIIILTAILSKVIENKYVKAILNGITPCMIGIILATSLYMILKNLFNDTFIDIDIRAVIITMILAAVLFGQRHFIKKSMSPITFIGISALLGAVGYSL